LKFVLINVIFKVEIYCKEYVANANSKPQSNDFRWIILLRKFKNKCII